MSVWVWVWVWVWSMVVGQVLRTWSRDWTGCCPQTTTSRGHPSQARPSQQCARPTAVARGLPPTRTTPFFGAWVLLWWSPMGIDPGPRRVVWTEPHHVLVVRRTVQ